MFGHTCTCISYMYNKDTLTTSKDLAIVPVITNITDFQQKFLTGTRVVLWRDLYNFSLHVHVCSIVSDDLCDSSLEAVSVGLVWSSSVVSELCSGWAISGNGVGAVTPVNRTMDGPASKKANRNTSILHYCHHYLDYR